MKAPKNATNNHLILWIDVTPILGILAQFMLNVPVSKEENGSKEKKENTF